MKRKADQTELRPRKKTKNDSGAKTNLLSLLPDEILREILSFLNDHNLRWTRLVDSRLFKLIDIRHFNIGVILQSELSEVTRVFGRYDKPIGLAFKKPNLAGGNIECLTQLTQLVSLDVGSDTIIRIDQKLTNLHALTASVVLDDLQHHTLLNALVAGHVYIDGGQKVILTQMQRLSVGQIDHFRVLDSKTEYYEDLITGMPNLKHLNLGCQFEFTPGIECHLTGLESLSTQVAIVDLPVSAMTGLTVLVEYWCGDDEWNITHLTNLRHLYINHKELLEHNSLLPFKLLESFTLKGSSLEERHLTQLNNTKMTQLEIGTKSSRVIEYLTTFCNLQRLSFTPCSNNMLFDLGQMSQLIHLTSLNILSPWDNLKNIKSVSTLTNLVELNLDSNEEIDLCNLTRLTRLAFKQTTLIDLSNTTRLMNLKFYGTRAPVGLSSLHNLTELHCQPLRSHEIFALTSLQLLNFAGDRTISDEDVMALSNLTRLTALTASTSGSGEHLTRMTRLQRLNFKASKGTPEIQHNLKTKLIYSEHLQYSMNYDKKLKL